MATVQTTTPAAGWHELLAPDVEPAKTFYSSLFGWELEVWRPGTADYAMARVDGRNHAGFFAREVAAPHWLVYFMVDDADATAARAVELGGRVARRAEDIPDVGRFVVLADPQGAIFAVIEPFEPEERATGVFVVDELMTTNVEDAERFYGELFGWRAEPSGDSHYVLFRGPGGEVVAGLMAKPEHVPAPAWMTYIGVQEVDAAAELARGLGATVAVPPTTIAGGVGSFAVLIDPAGAPFGVYKAGA